MLLAIYVFFAVLFLFWMIHNTASLQLDWSCVVFIVCMSLMWPISIVTFVVASCIRGEDGGG